jgi:hypothetical protein
MNDPTSSELTAYSHQKSICELSESLLELSAAFGALKDTTREKTEGFEEAFAAHLKIRQDHVSSSGANGEIQSMRTVLQTMDREFGIEAYLERRSQEGRVS